MAHDLGFLPSTTIDASTATTEIAGGIISLKCVRGVSEKDLTIEIII